MKRFLCMANPFRTNSICFLHIKFNIKFEIYRGNRNILVRSTGMKQNRACTQIERPPDHAVYSCMWSLGDGMRGNRSNRYQRVTQVFVALKCGWGQVSDSLVFGGQHGAGTSNFISESYPTHIWQIILVLYWSEREGRWVLNRLVGGSLQGRWAIIQSRVHKSIISTTWSKIRQQHRSSSYLPLAIPEVVWWIFIYLFLH